MVFFSCYKAAVDAKGHTLIVRVPLCRRADRAINRLSLILVLVSDIVVQF